MAVGKVTGAQASGFGEGCVGRTARLEVRTNDGTVTSTSEISEGRSASFSFSRPIEADSITGSSLSAS